jgi:cysteine desulfurase
MFWKKRIYLDAASGGSGNPSSPHTEGRQAREMLETARTTIARLTEVQSDDVIFTGGATEANALAIFGVALARKAKAGGDIHILYLPSAHASLVENAKLVATYGVTALPLPLRDTKVDVEALTELLKDTTALVTMEAVCGETGVVWNTREVAHAIRGKALLHVDASQAPLTQKITRAHFGADLLTLDISKVSSARGIGALIAHRTIELAPLYRGGGQERGVRPGSEAPLLAQTFAQALQECSENRETFYAAASSARAALISRLQTALPDVLINEGKEQVPNILNISLPGRDTDYLVALLDEEGFAVSTKSACETDSEQGSRAVFVLTKDEARARATLRVSWGENINQSDLNRFADALVGAVAFIDSNGQR